MPDEARRPSAPRAPLRLTPAEEEGWREVVRPLADLRSNTVSSIALVLARKCHEHVPQLEQDMFDTTVASAESGVSDILERMVEGKDPADFILPSAASAFARGLVHADVPVEVLLRVSHAAHSYLLRDWLSELQSRAVEDRAAFLGAVDYCERFLVAWFDGLGQQWAHEYMVERERWLGTAEAACAETIAAILAGHLSDTVLASRRLRYDVTRLHRAFVVWNDTSDLHVPTVLARAGTLVADTFDCDEHLVLPMGGSLAAGWVSASSPVRADDVRQVLRSSDAAGLRVAFGSPHAGIDGFRLSHQEALEARRVAKVAGRRSGPVNEYRLLALTALATSDLDQARRFIAEELGPLANQDDATVRIASTLRVYFQELGNATRTARRLGVHKNTVIYRIQQAEELLGRKIEERSLELQMALSLTRMIADNAAGPASDDASS
jgi:hypothetical protein